MRVPLWLAPYRPRLWSWLWILGCWAATWLECRLMTDLRNYYGPYWSPVLVFVAAVLLCACALGFWLNRPLAEAAPARALSRTPLAGLLLLAGFVRVLLLQAPLITAHPNTLAFSDVITILQTYVARFRSGEVVYRYLTNLNYPLFPNHLPLQWLPYVPADMMGIDYRWWSLGLLLLLGFGAYLLVLVRQPLPWPEFVLKALLPFVVLAQLINYTPDLYTFTCEPTIICYYCLLAAAVLSRSALLQGVGLVLCLLSRYSVVFWVPFYLWVLWREMGLRHALAVAGIVGAGIVGIYVIPFLSHDWTIFTHALAEYKIATLGEWSHVDDSGHPPQLFNGVGAASWFYTYGSGTLVDKIAALQRTHIIACVAIIGLIAGLYYRFRHRLPYQIAALLGLKLYLTVFYTFLQIPYLYLTSLGLFISLFVALTVGFRPRETQLPPPAAV